MDVRLGSPSRFETPTDAAPNQNSLLDAVHESELQVECRTHIALAPGRRPPEHHERHPDETPANC
jgi:hypothetical protein